MKKLITTFAVVSLLGFSSCTRENTATDNMGTNNTGDTSGTGGTGSGSTSGSGAMGTTSTNTNSNTYSGSGSGM